MGEEEVTSNTKVEDKTNSSDVKEMEEDNANSSEDPISTTDGEAQLDHSNRKIMVYNVHKHERTNHIKALLAEWCTKTAAGKTINIVRWKKPPPSRWFQLTVESEDMVEPFLRSVNELNPKTSKTGGTYLACRLGEDPAKHGLVGGGDRDDRNKRTRNRDGDDDGDDDSNRRNDSRGNKKRRGGEGNDGDGRNGGDRGPPKLKTDDEVRDQLTATWRQPYETQTIKKNRDMVNKCGIKIAKQVKEIFRKRTKEAKRNHHVKVLPIYPWATRGRPIELAKILPSPATIEYRNKIEFTFGYRYESPPATPSDETKEKNVDGNVVEPAAEAEAIKTPSVGYLAGGWAGAVSRPHILSNTPTEACGIADLINTFLSTSPMPPYDQKSHTGVWRTVTCRFSKRLNQCMVIIQHASPSGGAGANNRKEHNYSKHWKKERARLIKVLTKAPIPLPDRDYGEKPPPREILPNVPRDKEFLKKREELQAELDKELKEHSIVAPEKDHELTKPLKVTSIYFQEFDGLSMPNPEHPVQHAYGTTTFKEKLGPCTFRVSPGAFFQVNTRAAEVLYNVIIHKVREVAQKDKDPKETLLLDVCCGTGTIGLVCMKEGVVGKLVGVDISEPAIEDAKINAKLNGFSEEDCTFVASRAELVLSKEIEKAKERFGDHIPIVAVVDPARDGLHCDVIKALRTTDQIQRLVYVSCNPTGSFVKDAAMLCSPPTKKYGGLPFKPTGGQPVDMFPQTNHCELVMVFDRMTEEENSGLVEDKEKVEMEGIFESKEEKKEDVHKEDENAKEKASKENTKKASKENTKKASKENTKEASKENKKEAKK